MGASAPIDLLEDGIERTRYKHLIIGCGNLLRGDDAAGPVLIRRMWETTDFPQDIQLADGGTSGMDVVFKMRDADNVIIVDAAKTGAKPGTVYQVPGSEIEEVPAVSGGSHDFRWDHAISVARWLLGDHMPKSIEVYLIEGSHYEYGGELSPEVSDAVDAVARRITQEVLYP